MYALVSKPPPTLEIAGMRPIEYFVHEELIGGRRKSSGQTIPKRLGWTSWQICNICDIRELRICRYSWQIPFFPLSGLVLDSWRLVGGEQMVSVW